MSSKKTSEVWASQLPPRLKLAALALAELSDATGRWAGAVADVCKLTGQSERTTQEALAELEHAGAVRRIQTPGKSTVYSLTPAEVAPPPPQDSHPTTTPTRAPAPINGARKLLEAQFSEFWTAYPRKVGKPKALTAYLQLQPDTATHHKMLRDLLKRSKTADWLKEAGAFIPHPTTYLNQRRFDDEPTDTSAPQRFVDGLPEA